MADIPAQVRGIGTVVVGVTDIDRALAFYKDTLGFTEGEQMLSPGVTLVAGDANIYVVGGREPGQARDISLPQISLMLVVPGLKLAYEALVAAGVTVVEEYDQPSDFFASCSIADPDGNVIELVGKP